MTRIEWVRKNHPDHAGEEYKDGVIGCPFHYSDMPGGHKTFGVECYPGSCDECWNEEVDDVTQHNAV